MIELIHTVPYLSLKDEDYILNDFSVITGLNGSGKTHLLNAIDQGIIKVTDINKSAIAYYNYNDFSLNEKASENEKLKSKETMLMDKFNDFNEELQLERRTILNSYKVWNESLFVPKDFFENGELAVDSFDWTNEEIDFFRTYEKENKYRPHLSQQKDLLGGYILQNQNPNIENLISELKHSLIKHHLLISIRNINIDFLLNIDWDDSEIEKYNLKKKNNSNYKFLPTIVGTFYSDGFNSGFVNFIVAIDSNPFLCQIEQQLGLKKLKTYLLELSSDIKEYFRKNISREYLKQAIQIHGEENICDYIQVDHGFLNLQEIANAEKNYQYLKIENNYRQFITTQNETIKYYNEEEFLKIYGSSPVDLLNEVLNEYDCNGYEFRKSNIHIDLYNGIARQSVSIELYNKLQKYTTNLDALSSGEKTLIALSFYLYKLQQNKVITRLLLLDEIDSTLHPSMSKRLLDVLYNIFYKKKGIKIIISTHSPSTVALAPEESIFVMDKYSTPKIIKSSKDKALKKLTLGVPSFSVNYENRRQVFVESEYDASYYESLYNIYNDKLNPEISLNFISSGKTKINGNGIGIASCDQVVNIVDILRKAGNNFSWGIIDWDLKNKSTDYVKILGDSERYSVENYLLDPLLLAVLLWKENILNAEHFGFEKNEVYFNILHFNQSQLQQIVDKIISDIQINLKSNALSELVNYTLCNGIVLQIPIWYCKTQGHSLEENIIMKTYPQLEAIRKKDESALKKAVINKVILNFKDLSSVDLLDIFRSIQED
ncbi:MULTISPECIES: AAA family ATPase [Chryseobacterium]|uniref:AAA family ATPase n=1 Tax=Chryseobacterium TaxID=59732 RepID=UPI001CBF7EF1|nr:AAA family ATPase [Chryseobacterium lathyri]